MFYVRVNTGFRAIYNTHSHADHIGGNRYLQTNTGCMIYAPGIECDFTRHPVLEPSYLYGGCPPAELKHKFLMAKESDALPLDEHALPEGWEMIPLPGHSFDMVGFRTPDDVVYLADCLASAETLGKYQVSFIVDICSRPIMFEDILKNIFDEYGLEMTFEQYVLIGSTVRSYLTWLKETGRLHVEISDNRMMWSKV